MQRHFYAKYYAILLINSCQSVEIWKWLKVLMPVPSPVRITTLSINYAKPLFMPQVYCCAQHDNATLRIAKLRALYSLTLFFSTNIVSGKAARRQHFILSNIIGFF